MGGPFRNLPAIVELSAALSLCCSINLWEMVEFLLKQDVVNAINLDGGASLSPFCAQRDLGQLPIRSLVSLPESPSGGPCPGPSPTVSLVSFNKYCVPIVCSKEEEPRSLPLTAHRRSVESVTVYHHYPNQ